MLQTAFGGGKQGTVQILRLLQIKIRLISSSAVPHIVSYKLLNVAGFVVFAAEIVKDIFVGGNIKMQHNLFNVLFVVFCVCSDSCV